MVDTMMNNALRMRALCVVALAATITWPAAAVPALSRIAQADLAQSVIVEVKKKVCKTLECQKRRCLGLGPGATWTPAVRVGGVLRVRRELGEASLRLFLRGIGDVAEVRRNVRCVARRPPINGGTCGPTPPEPYVTLKPATRSRPEDHRRARLDPI